MGPRQPFCLGFSVGWLEAVTALVLIPTVCGRGFASEEVIYSFSGGNDGSGPNDLIMDQAGKLYGTTFDGGGPAGAGIVFRLSPETDGRQMG
jgi:uncharacterized repeat protein (TIGR03803 family)